MKPRVFIGSSSEGKSVADAIDANLQGIAEPVVWAHGVFGLSGTTVTSLMDQVANADFGIFVFSKDDTAEIRGKLLNVPRDNVVYELGLFSGAMGPERCFFLTPTGDDMHLPSDLLGMTGGRYDPDRRDRNIQAAVNPFCSQVKEKIQELGYRYREKIKEVRELATAYECCEWIVDADTRIAKKQMIFDNILQFFKGRRINKRLLAQNNRVGFYVAVAAAIVANPEAGDTDILLQLDRISITRGITQRVFVDAMNALKDAKKITATQKKELEAWAGRFLTPDSSLRPEIDKFSS
jgi:hypothetical protein